MKAKSLVEQRIQIISLAASLFNKITSLPKEVRADDKERKGIQIFMRRIGTRDLIFASVYEPSEAAQFFSVEKAVRSEILEDYASQNSENPNQMRFAGSITVDCFEDASIQSSVSGLKPEEDVLISIVLMAFVLNEPVHYVVQSLLVYGGKLPECFFEEGHYLNKILEDLK